jgi:hypothetical protein
MFPEALVQRCFVLEPSEDHIRQSAHALTNLVMFPPGDWLPGRGTALPALQQNSAHT